MVIHHMAHIASRLRGGNMSTLVKVRNYFDFKTYAKAIVIERESI